MKTKNMKHAAIAVLLIVMIPLLFTGFDKPVTFKSYNDILKRIPGGDLYMVSVNVNEFLNSKLSDFVMEVSGHNKEFRVFLNEEAEEFPLNLENVDRVTFFADDVKHRIMNFGAIVSGKNLKIDLQRILRERYMTDDIVRIEGQEVHLFIHDRPHRNIEKAYVYYDDTEIIVANKKAMMVNLLKLKKGDGTSQDGNRDVKDKLKRMKKKDGSWFYFPTDQLAQDVMRKVYMRRPDFQGQTFELESISGNCSFADFFEFGLQAYNPAQDQLDILFDLAYGVRGMTMLSLIDYPEVREILAKIELEKKNGYIGVEGKFSEKDFETLRRLHLIR